MIIKDYAHYYIGCDSLIDYMIPGGKKVIDYKGKFIAYDLRDESPYCVKGEHDTIWTYSIRPILRRLSDMTEEEAIRVARLCFFDRDKGYPDSDFTARKTSVASETPTAFEVRIDNDWYDEVIKIGFNTGNIWRCNGSAEHLHNQPGVFHYLLRQHFDLFNLIDNGLAVDAKTLKS